MIFIVPQVAIVFIEIHFVPFWNAFPPIQSKRQEIQSSRSFQQYYSLESRPCFVHPPASKRKRYIYVYILKKKRKESDEIPRRNRFDGGYCLHFFSLIEFAMYLNNSRSVKEATAALEKWAFSLIGQNTLHNIYTKYFSHTRDFIEKCQNLQRKVPNTFFLWKNSL